tara:strand:+ start:4265 stop:4603 length:339 start_codon:yes stop_codon:yes gene_type:complete
MTILSNFSLLSDLSQIDPGPFFVLSLFPYLAFLYWAQKSSFIPKISLLGFRLTVLFVLMTIILAIVAKIFYDDELTNIDYLHGIAEAFLTLSDALVVFGFLRAIQEKEVKNS